MIAPSHKRSSSPAPQFLHELSTIEHLTSRGAGAHTPALIDPQERLSFVEFADAVARLAGLLTHVGVHRGDRVAVHLHKSIHSFVAAHAILRVGGVVVPLDPLAPPDHAQAVLSDADPTALLTDGSVGAIASLVSSSGVRCVVSRGGELEGRVTGPRFVDWSEASEIEQSPPARRDVADPAYIIYTSGSTGRPKGIVHTHRSAMAYARSAARTYGLTSSDRLANVASLHFDQSTFELYAAPLAGASVVVVPEPVLRFPASTSELLEQERVTVWYSVPYILRQLAERGALAQRDLSSLRWILFGGESYPPGELRTLMALVPTARVSNVYGPAEVNQCTHRHFDAPPKGDDPLPIGRPWENAEVAVVGPDLRRLEDGNQGELLVSTPTAMAGYWRRPDLTASSFVDFEGAGVWYRTGDLVRVDDRGELTFLGRTDNQVKIRGHRVEIEAVETALIGLRTIRDCGVAVDPGSHGARLVAAVVADAPVQARTVQRDLASRLPPASVPNSIVQVDHIPRAPGGKLDRRELYHQLGLAGTSTNESRSP